MARLLAVAVVLCLIGSTLCLSVDKRAISHKAKPSGHGKIVQKASKPARHHHLEEDPDQVMRYGNLKYMYYTMDWEDIKYVYEAGLYIRFNLQDVLEDERDQEVGSGTANYMGRPESLIDRIFGFSPGEEMSLNEVVEYVADHLEVNEEHKIMQARAAIIHTFQEALREASTTGLAHYVDDPQSYAFLVAARQAEEILTFRTSSAAPWGAYIHPSDGNDNAVVYHTGVRTYPRLEIDGAAAARDTLELAMTVQAIRAIRHHRNANKPNVGGVPTAGTILNRLTKSDWMVSKATALFVKVNKLTTKVAALMDADECNEGAQFADIPEVARFVDFTWPKLNSILEDGMEADKTMTANLRQACANAIKRGEVKEKAEELDVQASRFRKLTAKFKRGSTFSFW